MATALKLDQCERVLVVEGYSDLLFYAEVLEAVGKLDGVFIKHFNGREDLQTKLETFLTPQLLLSKVSIGIVVDADASAVKAATNLSSLLTKLTGQTVVQSSWTTATPRLGFFIAPDGTSSGEIETLVWRAWADDPGNAKAQKCVETYCDCMGKAGFHPQSPDKGLVSSLLAIRNDDDPRLGPGARARNIFDFNRPEYKPLKDFLSAI
jgi:hypothetical protein